MPESSITTIRLATREDAESLFQLERQAVTASHWSLAEYQRILVGEAAARIVLVAERPATVAPVGFLVARTVGAEWEIENLAVAPEKQRQGIGKALLQELFRQAVDMGSRSVMLEVRESNQPARALYAGAGFQPIAQREGYYRDPEEACVVYQIELVR